jgi:hypothetical protein
LAPLCSPELQRSIFTVSYPFTSLYVRSKVHIEKTAHFYLEFQHLSFADFSFPLLISFSLTVSDIPVCSGMTFLLYDITLLSYIADLFISRRKHLANGDNGRCLSEYDLCGTFRNGRAYF